MPIGSPGCNILKKHMEQLEKQLQALNQKFDKILELLERNKAKEVKDAR